jgi:hypothetical protein
MYQWLSYIYLHPSSTTYVKHFISTTSPAKNTSDDYAFEHFTGGYANTTSAIRCR